jgi:hypothetical protein
VENNVLILTINDCPGIRVVRVIGPVYGTGVRSRTSLVIFWVVSVPSSAENRVVISK